MSLPEENFKPQKKYRKSNIFIFFLLLIVIIGAAYLVYLKSQDTDLRQMSIQQIIDKTFLSGGKEKEKEIFEIKYDINEHAVFSVYKDTLIKCTREFVKGLGKKGDELWSVPVTLANPLVKTSGQNLMVADIGGKDIYMMNGKEIKWNKKLDSSILNVDINEAGHVAVLHEAKGYKGAVTVLNLQGNEFFTRTIAEFFLISAKVSPDAKSVVINGVDASGVKARGSLSFTDIYGNPLAGKTLQENSVFPLIWYMDKDCLAAVGKNSLICFDGMGKEKWKKEFEEGKIYSSAVSPEKHVAIAVRETGNGDVFNSGTVSVKIFDRGGKEVGTFNVEDEIKNLQTFGDVIAVSTGRQVFFINQRGKQVGKYNSKTDVTGVCFFSMDEAAIITKTSVVITPIKN